MYTPKRGRINEAGTMQQQVHCSTYLAYWPHLPLPPAAVAPSHDPLWVRLWELNARSWGTKIYGMHISRTEVRVGTHLSTAAEPRVARRRSGTCLELRDSSRLPVHLYLPYFP